ncbi:MAG: protein-L-isoaspartate O-methyltransferase [Alphaproteobacteria bacterium]|nr:protein-L-isoaspartate O-methyltransferase [Alphaproteobacteria bacterium]
MTDFAAARLNMVEGQIRTNRVTDPVLIDALLAVPRELFVPPSLRSIAYVDEDLPLGRGRYLMEPVVLARMLQVASITPSEAVLDIGCASGYSTAVIAKLAGSVVAIDADAELVKRANQILSELGADNAAVVQADTAQGYARQAPYNVVVLGGAVDFVPDAITDQLVDGGRLVAVVRDEGGVGRATLMTRVGSSVSSRIIFDAATPRLPGFAREPGFVF